MSTSGSWITAPVKKEMLTSVNEAIEKASDGIGAIKSIVMVLAGVARVSGMRGAIRFLDDLASAISSGYVGDNEIKKVVVPALQVLAKYLDREINGSNISPMLLYKAHSAILVAANKEVPYEGILFYPSTNYNGYGLDEQNANQVSAEAFTEVSDLYFSSFKEGLVVFNQGDRKEGITAMRQALVTLETKNPHPKLRLFFDAAIAALDALRGEKGASNDFSTLRMISDTLSSMTNGGALATDDTLSSLLFVVAKRRRQNARSKRINDRLGTDALISSVSTGNVEGFKLSSKQKSFVKVLISQMEKESEIAITGNTAGFIEASNKAAGLNGAPDPLLSTIGEAMGLVEKAIKLNSNNASKVVNEAAIIVSILQDLVDGQRNENQPAVVSRQKNALARLAGIEVQDDDVVVSGSALGEDFGQQLMGEVRAELNLVELVADSIANGTLDDSQRSTLSRSFGTIGGAMSILGDKNAANLVKLLTDAVMRNQEVERQKIVDGVGYLSSFIDAYRSGAKDAGSLLKKGIAIFTDEKAVTVQMKTESSEGVDIPNDEFLLEVFLEEADGVLDTIKTGTTVLESSFDKTEMINIRRAFHTLKGSARMVGLEGFGECAWQAEQVMNDWNTHNRPPSAELIAFFREMYQQFTGFVGTLTNEKRLTVSAAHSKALAEKLLGSATTGLTQSVSVVKPVEVPVIAEPIIEDLAIGDNVVSETETMLDSGFAGEVELSLPEVIVPDSEHSAPVSEQLVVELEAVIEDVILDDNSEDSTLENINLLNENGEELDISADAIADEVAATEVDNLGISMDEPTFTISEISADDVDDETQVTALQPFGISAGNELSIDDLELDEPSTFDLDIKPEAAAEAPELSEVVVEPEVVVVKFEEDVPAAKSTIIGEIGVPLQSDDYSTNDVLSSFDKMAEASVIEEEAKAAIEAANPAPAQARKVVKRVVKRVQKQEEYVPEWMPNWLANIFRAIGKLFK